MGALCLGEPVDLDLSFFLNRILWQNPLRLLALLLIVILAGFLLKLLLLLIFLLLSLAFSRVILAR